MSPIGDPRDAIERADEFLARICPDAIGRAAALAECERRECEAGRRVTGPPRR